MKITKRIIAIILAALIVMPLLLSCNKEQEKDQSHSTTIATQAGEETSRENTPDSLPKDLDFGGEEVTIYYGWEDPNVQTKLNEMEGSVDGTALSQAVYNRNIAVEQRLNIDLVYDQSGATSDYKSYKTSVEYLLLSSAYDSGVDIIYQYLGSSVGYANNGYIRKVSDLNYIDLEKPWWFTDQMKNIPLKEDEMCILLGDLFASAYSNMTSIYFNKDMYNDLYANEGRKYTELYDLVDSGEWTFENYFKIISEAYSDDGNGFINLGDNFGAHVDNIANGVILRYAYGSGLNFMPRDDEGFPTLNFNTDQTISLIEQLYSFAHENQGVLEMTSDELDTEFFAERVMFYARFLGRGAAINANTTFNYGVLPFPKLSTEQDYSTIVLTGSGSFIIPQFIPDEKMDIIGATLEALFAESYRKVILEYYDVILKVKYSGEDRDADMVDIIKDHVNVDYSMWNGGLIGKPDNIFRTVVQVNASKDFASEWDKIDDTCSTKLQTLIDTYKSVT